MEASESGRSRAMRGEQEDGNRGVEDDEDWEGGSDRRKDKSGKSRRHLDQEDAEEQLESGRRRGSGDKSDGRKRLGVASNRADSGEDDDYDVRRDLRSKLPKRSSDERGGERRFSDGYREVERESGGRKSRCDEMERDSEKKSGARGSGYEGDPQIRSRSRVERVSHEADFEKATEKDSRYTDRKDGSREKGYVSREQDRNLPRRRWDEGDPSSGRKVEEAGYGERSDTRSGKVSEHNKLASSRDRVTEVRNDSIEGKYKVMDANAGKSTRSGGRDDKRVDGERGKGRERLENQDEDLRQVAASRESRQDAFRDDRRRDYEKLVDDLDSNVQRSGSRLHSEKGDKHRQPRESGHGSRDDVDLRERSAKLDEDGHGRVRDRNGRETRPNRRSRTPEKRHFKEHDELDRVYSESDNERGMALKGNEREKDSYRDDRSSSKVKESGWTDRSREREPPKDQWKRNHAGRQDRDHRDGDVEYEYDKEWDSKRREQEWMDGDKFHGRPAYRKDNRSRHDGMRPSSNFGNAHEHSDSIEIRPNKSLDFGKEESLQTYPGRRVESGSQQEAPAGNDEEWGYQADDKNKMTHGYGDDNRERYPDDSSPARRSFPDARGKGSGQKAQVNYNSAGGGQGMQPLHGSNQGPGFNNRPTQQGAKSGRHVRGGRGRLNGRDTQRVGLPLPVMGPPFAHLGMPPGPLQPMGPNMSPTPGPPLGPNVFMPPFPGPLVWQGARVDMNMLGVPPALSPIPPGPLGPRFPPNMPPGPNHGMYFNQPGPGRGAPPSMPGQGFSQAGPIGRGAQHDKPSSGWTPNRSSGPPGKAPSRGEQNDYSQNFVDTGMRPQNFIRELELTSTVEDYPKLRELIQKKDEIVAKSASPPMYYKCDLREHVLSSEFYGTKFDVILVDPPWEEYVHRAPGVADHMEYWSFEEILSLRIEAIADTPSFIFLWVGDGVGLEQGRQCLKKWGFRRCEDICWVKTNKSNATPSLRHDSHTLFQHSKEHCLMGIKGTVRRSTDGHIIHANIDTDIIIAEEPPYGSTKKPEDIYRIIEHFSLGRRRLELFGEDHNIRSGWLTVGKGLSSSNFSSEVYCRNFADKDGKVWLGGGGRNPPPEAPHLVLTTPDIESLRPKSPPQKNQQPQSTSISTTANSKRQAGNSPQNHQAAPGLAAGQEVSSSNPPVPWASSPLIGGFKGPEVGSGGPDDKFFDGYVFNPMHRQVNGDRIEFEPHRTINMM